MQYRELLPVSAEEAKSAFALNNEEEVICAVLGCAIGDNDWKWIQETCITYFDDPREYVRAAAILGISHMARIHRAADLSVLLPRLEALKSSESSVVSGRAEDTLDDLRTFFPNEF